MFKKKNVNPKNKAYYIPSRVMPGDDRNIKDFNLAVGILENLIKLKLKSDYIRIGYDVVTNNDLLNTDIKELLYQGKTSRLLLWERNYWYLYRYENVNKFLEILKITHDFGLQVFNMLKHVEIIKIYNTVPKFDKGVEHNEMYDYPTRVFKHRIFSIVPITENEYNKLKELKQPFYKFNKKLISVDKLQGR